jgi:RHS repeat-associated protein
LGDQVTSSLPDPSTGLAGGATTTRRYNLDQQLVAAIDPLGNTATYTFDAYGNQIKQVLPSTGDSIPTTTFTYDANHFMRSLTDPDSYTTTWTPDNDGRAASETTLAGTDDSATEYFTRDLAGNLSDLVDFDGRATTYARNFLSQVAGENWYSTSAAGGTPLNSIGYAYSTLGQLLDGSDTFGSGGGTNTNVALAYDSLGNLTGDVQSIDSRADAAVSSTWNSDGTRSGLGLTIGTTADLANAYTYDYLQRLMSIAQTGVTGGNTVANKFVTIGYNAAGLTTSIDTYLAASADSGSQVMDEAIAYDNVSRITGLTYTSSRTSATLAAYQYAFDTDGAVSHFWSYNDTADTADRTSAYSTWAEVSYAYNADQELAAAFESGGGSGGSGGGDLSATYYNFANAPATDNFLAYDANGNRTDSGHTSTANRVTFDGTYYYQYDANGNRTEKYKSGTGALDDTATDITTYEWDNRNRMTRLTHQAAYGDTPDMDIRETYDALDRLVEEKDVASGGTMDERYVWDGESLLAVLDADDNVTEREMNGPNADQVFATEMVGGAYGGVNWLLTDGQYSVRDVARATVSGGGVSEVALVNHIIYDAYGNLPVPQSAGEVQYLTRIMFTGLRFDPASGFYLAVFRYYDPATGTWIKPDPDGFLAGDTNLYRYCGNNPVTRSDPSGLSWGEWNPWSDEFWNSGYANNNTGLAAAPPTTTPIPAYPPTLSMGQMGQILEAHPGTTNTLLANGDHHMRNTISDSGNAYIYELTSDGWGNEYYERIEIQAEANPGDADRGMFNQDLAMLEQRTKFAEGYCQVMGNIAILPLGLEEIGMEGACELGEVGEFPAELEEWLAQCFPAGTLVATPRGQFPIESLKVGDEVWAYDLVVSRWVARKILRTYVSDHDGTSAKITVAGETIEATFLHPFWVVSGEDLNYRPIREHLARVPEGATTSGRWVDAGDVRVGDQLLLRDGRTMPVEAIRHQAYCDKVYNFHVEDLQCYAVGRNSLLVHNVNGVEEAKNLMEGIKEINRTLINNMKELQEDGFLENALAARHRYWQRICQIFRLPLDTPPPVDF